MRSAKIGCVLLSAAVLAACGGGGSGTGTGSSKSSKSSATSSDDGVDATVQSLLEGATGQRGSKVDGPGKLRFVNLLVRNGKGVDLDVYWGRPDEKDKAATVRFGEASDYVTPRMAKGFDAAVYTATVAGTTEEVWSWDRFSPKDKTQRTVLWFAGDDGNFNEAALDEPADLISDYTGKPNFPPPSSGKVRLYWRVLGKGIDSGDDLLAVMSGGTCLTNGSGIAGPDRNQLNDEQTFEVAPGASLQLFPNCSGAPVGAAVQAPASGRAILVAYVAPGGGPTLKVIPVKG